MPWQPTRSTPWDDPSPSAAYDAPQQQSPTPGAPAPIPAIDYRVAMEYRARALELAIKLHPHADECELGSFSALFYRWIALGEWR